MIRRTPKSTLFPTRRSSDLWKGSEEEFRRKRQKYLLYGEHAVTKATLPNPLKVAPAIEGKPAAAIQSRPETPFANSAPDRKSTRLNSSHVKISYAVFCLKKK